MLLAGLRVLTNAKLPDALRLSGLQNLLKILLLQAGSGVHAAYGMNKEHFISNLKLN